MVAARTAPNRSVRFGGEHGALDHRGARDAAELASVAERSAVPVVGPELSVVQTACSMRSEFVVNPDLRSLDVGRWHSMRPDEVPHAELGAWFADPHWDGHGGESVAAFVDRIHDAVDSMSSGASGSSGVLVVAGPVAQALLCGTATNFFHTEVRPASVHTAVR